MTASEAELRLELSLSGDVGDQCVCWLRNARRCRISQARRLQDQGGAFSRLARPKQSEGKPLGWRSMVVRHGGSAGGGSAVASLCRQRPMSQPAMAKLTSNEGSRPVA